MFGEKNLDLNNNNNLYNIINNSNNIQFFSCGTRSGEGCDWLSTDNKENMGNHLPQLTTMSTHTSLIVSHRAAWRSGFELQDKVSKWK